MYQVVENKTKILIRTVFLSRCLFCLTDVTTADAGRSARFHLDEITKRVPFPFWLHSQFNFLNKEGLFSYFAPDLTISRYCMSSIRSKPSKQLLIVCQTKRLVDAVWTTSRPQFTASKALFSRVFAGFDELEWDQCFWPSPKWAKIWDSAEMMCI